MDSVPFHLLPDEDPDAKVVYAHIDEPTLVSYNWSMGSTGMFVTLSLTHLGFYRLRTFDGQTVDECLIEHGADPTAVGNLVESTVMDYDDMASLIAGKPVVPTVFIGDE